MSSGPPPADAAYQGAPGAFSEEAARRLAGAAARLMPCATLDDVFAAVASGACRTAVVPVENSLAGPVPGCEALIARYAVRVVDECTLRIAHALIACPGVSIDQVRLVRSHPVALAQCAAFLRAHPAMRVEPAPDTAGAVAVLVRAGTPGEAAVASARAARLYGGVVLRHEIQDVHDNFTRFVRVSARHRQPRRQKKDASAQA